MPRPNWPIIRVLILSLGTAVAVSSGCTKPEVDIPEARPIEPAAEAPEKSGEPGMATINREASVPQAPKANDYMALLHESLTEAKKLKTLRLNFVRQERLGLLRELRPKEDINADYRDEPFSVRFTWNDADSEYRQCVYVHGREDNKVLLLPRKGLLGLPASVQKYPAEFAVTFQKARNPITDFGPRRMMERIIDRIEKARPHGDVIIKRLADANIGPANEACHHLELRFPEGDQYACKLQDLYISKSTKLPVATYLWIPGKTERSDQTLDAMYVYADLRPNVELSDTDFVIDEPAGKSAKPAKTSTDGGEDSAEKSAARTSDEPPA